MKTLFKLALLLFFIESHAQIGINTSSPDAQLDIEATNAATPSNTDGLLIPRVNAFPAINPTAAQQGMMVYLMVTSGINTPGFYYWDNLSTSWIGISSTANGDKDWYKVGTTTAPSAITDDMFHSGKVGIGNSSPTSKLHVMNNASGMTPNPFALATLENDNFTFLNLLAASESGILFGRGTSATDGGIIYNTNGMIFRTNGNVNRMILSDAGNVAIGSFAPVYPLHFQASVGDKISLFGSSAAHYGFGIQSALLQIHSAGITDDIAFGYGSSAAFTENMRIKGNGNVGIGHTNPLTKFHIKQNSSGMTPNTESFATIENDTNTFLNILSTLESGVVFGANGNSTNGGIIYNTWPNSLAFRTNGNQNRMTISDAGNVAIGNFKADYPLHFSSVLGDKVSLWGTGDNHYGFGLQSNLLQIHSDFDFSDIAFGYGSSGAFTENVRFTGDGFVGIGENNPTVPLSFASTLGNKVSMWGNSSANYGFSVQSLALQIHTANSNGDVVFGSGNTASLTETMRIKGNGNVGIGLTNPLSKLHIKLNASGTTPNPNALATLENSNQTYFNLLSGTESGILFGTSTNATSGAIVFNQATVPNGLQFRTNNNQNRMTISDLGNIGIGDFKSDFPLQFEGVLGDKISLFGSAGNHYGFGLQSALMQIHSATSTDDIAFGYGSSASFTERMRIKGTGEVGIGTNAPTAELEVNGFTKMGTTAPAVKMLKFTGTTAAIQGNNTVILHGLTSSKILAVNVLVEYVAGSSVPPSYTASVGYEYDYFVSAAGITIWNKAGNSANILSKPFRILVTYEE
jgi:hypothetical protein